MAVGGQFSSLFGLWLGGGCCAGAFEKILCLFLLAWQAAVAVNDMDGVGWGVWVVPAAASALAYGAFQSLGTQLTRVRATTYMV